MTLAWPARRRIQNCTRPAGDLLAAAPIPSQDPPYVPTQDAKAGPENLLPRLAVAGLMALALLCVASSFVVHMTPDISTYLLHARTFLQEHNRFAVSHDSKGILLTWALAWVVWILGPTVVAGALAQLAAYTIGSVCFYWFLRSWMAATAALILVLLVICLLFSPYTWGGNMRPEDFAFAYCGVALYATWRGTGRWLSLAGAMVACSFQTKTTLGLAPAALVLTGCVANASGISGGQWHAGSWWLSLGKGLLWALLGFAVVSAVVLGWIVLVDDWAGWYRQTIEWPFRYRIQSMSLLCKIRCATVLGWHSRLGLLFVAGCVGLAGGCRRGPRRQAVLLAALLIAELMRVILEGGNWPYLLTLIILPLVASTSLLGLSGRSRVSSRLAWMIPFCLATPILPAEFKAKATGAYLRMLRRYPSPQEYLVTRLRGRYLPGESLFVDSNDLQAFLLLDAPRPAPILPVHWPLVTPPEQQTTADYYRLRPPDWIITQYPPETSSAPILGWVNHAYYVQIPTAESQAGASYSCCESAGHELSPVLPASRRYRLEVDTGYLLAWHILP